MHSRQMRPMVLVALIGAATGCGQTVLPGEELEFTLRVGQVARLADHDAAVEFIGVTQDSRCPEDAVCVWQGDGAIALRITGDSGSLDTTLHTTLVPRSLSRDGLSLEVVGLSPLPHTGRTIDPSAYQVRLRASRS